MRTLFRTLLAGFLATNILASDVFAAAPEPPLEEKRLSVSTLVREDIFSGWMDDDMERFARGEKNLEILLEKRPRNRAESLGWLGGAKLYRAALANEAGNAEEFDRYFQEAKDHFAEALELGPKQAVVHVLIGGAYVLFADRLPEEHQAAAWTECFDRYTVVWGQQGRIVDKLPLHVGGELLAGLAPIVPAHRQSG